MICKNIYCVYNKESKCNKIFVSINESGLCSDIFLINPKIDISKKFRYFKNRDKRFSHIILDDWEKYWKKKMMQEKLDGSYAENA